ncbi:MAG TPA: glycosyltransferase, partial [Aggregatilineales bacterium]|nr:glycosyltransferase [Aggregatilineales bacterium]
NLVRALAQQDSVRVFAMRYPPRRDRYIVYGAQVISLGGHSRLAGLRRWPLLTRTVQTVIQEHRRQPFDVLHAIWADETGFAACVAGRVIGVPVVVSIAGGELVALPGYGLQSGRVSRWLVRQAIRHADQVIAPSRFAGQLVPATLRGRDRIAIVPLGVDTTLFKPMQTSAEAQATHSFRLLSVGSLIAVKGHELLLKVVARLPGVTLDIVGYGPLLPTLQAQAKTLGIADRVTFRGEVRHDLLPALYQEADLLILTSQHEAYGMVIVEAAACGLPTIGSASGVLPEFAQQDAGIALPVGDLAALYEAIRDLIHDPIRLSMMRKKAHELVINCYTIAKMAAGIRNVYTSIAQLMPEPDNQATSA